MLGATKKLYIQKLLRTNQEERMRAKILKAIERFMANEVDIA